MDSLPDYIGLVDFVGFMGLWKPIEEVKSLDSPQDYAGLVDFGRIHGIVGPHTFDWNTAGCVTLNRWELS